MNDQSPPGTVTTISTQTVWQRHTRLDLVQFTHAKFDGTQSPVRNWEVWRRGAAVAVLPYDPAQDLLVLIEQFRYPAWVAGLDPIMLELPAGFVERDEPPEQAAARELQEETALHADRLERIGHVLLSAGGSDETVTIYAGRVQAPAADPAGIAGLGGLASENEDIRIRTMPAAEATAHALAGAYPNSVTSLALLWLAARHSWLRNKWLNP